MRVSLIAFFLLPLLSCKTMAVRSQGHTSYDAVLHGDARKLQPFLNQAALNANMEAIAPAELEERLKARYYDIAEHIHEGVESDARLDPEKDKGQDEFSACSFQKQREGWAFRIDRDESSLLIAKNYDTSACSGKIDSKEFAMAEEVKLRLYTFSRCNYLDTFVGSTPQELWYEFSSQDNCSGRMEFQNQSDKTVRHKPLRAGDEAKLVSVQTIRSTQTEGGGPCATIRRDKIRMHVEPCVTFVQEVKTTAGGSTTDYLLLKKTLHWNFEEGKLQAPLGEAEFTFNDWKGKVTYHGSGTRPTFSASNGTSTASGTIPRP